MKTPISCPGSERSSADGWTTMDSIVALGVIALCSAAILGGATALGSRSRSLAASARADIEAANEWSDGIASSARR